MPEKRNRKEVLWSSEDMKLIKFASAYYGLDQTNTIRLLVRTSVLGLIAKCQSNGFFKLTAEEQKVIISIFESLKER